MTRAACGGRRDRDRRGRASCIARGNSYQIFIIVTVGLTAIVGIGLNVLLGLSGQISLGHVAFYAIGAYAVGILTTNARMVVLAGASS